MAMIMCRSCIRTKLSRKFIFHEKLSSNNINFKMIGKHSRPPQPWDEPSGHDTGIHIYNSSSKSKVSLKTRHPGVLTWYACGPTVYDSAHIGHGLCYVKTDIMRRILQNVFQINVVQVMGITDIDDKIITKARDLNISTRTLAQQYEEEFVRDMKKLNVLPPLLYSRVSDHISHILSFIQNLVGKGLAYALEDGSVYFDTEAFGRYGQIASLPGLRFVDSLKKSPRDFALWKGAKENELSWISPWGAGRPGWHIECSAIACHIFGEHLDLHSGGIDLLFPHHENEEVQCQARHDTKRWCNYWIHTGHLRMKNSSDKMSKSLKNTLSIQKFLERHSSNVFRLFCLITSHQNEVEYNDDILKEAEAHSKKIKLYLQDSQAYIHSQITCGPLDDELLLRKLSHAKSGIREALADNFNTAQSMTLLMGLIGECHLQLRKDSKKALPVSSSLGTVAAITNYVLKILGDFGMQYPQMVSSYASDSFSDLKVPIYLNIIANFRNDVRNFALLKDQKSLQANLSRGQQEFLRQDRLPLLEECDSIRDEMLHHGVQLMDLHDQETSWRYAEEKISEKK